MILAERDLESDGRKNPIDEIFTDRRSTRGACGDRRVMPNDHSGFEGGDALGVALLLVMLRQTMATMSAAEVLRSELIGMIEWSVTRL